MKNIITSFVKFNENNLHDILEKKKQLLNNQPITIYRGFSSTGYNFSKKPNPLYTYYTLSLDKAKYYGTGYIKNYFFNENSLQIKIFKGDLFDKFNKICSIEDTDVINTLKSEGYSAAIIKSDELVVFDNSLVKEITIENNSITKTVYRGGEKKVHP